MVLRFPETLILKIFYLYHSHFRHRLLFSFPLKDVPIMNRDIINYGVLCGHPDHNNPRYCKGRRFGVCAAVSERALLTCYPIFALK